MYYKLDEDEQKKITKISDMTCTDYELTGDFISVENLVSMIEDLLIKIDILEEEIEDIKKDREDNYKPLSNKELYDVSDKDFI